ncbi:matrixin family metalloprotease [Arthrobacter sp. ISL-30]|uniref:matrixin family metalloprotease n=1 Tax=Arthrobacter sp. ISL-30 TaxID=2819109 RepID=UPI001BE82DA9|nr:matrixin family metalloprotease [Arthrobacter sp. ISL-30]MBT2512567.1 peptidase [Arthrobacter sp. ISL-30]
MHRNPDGLPLRASWEPDRRRQWPRPVALVLGVALLVGLYFTPALFERFVLPAALPYLPNATVPPPGFEAADRPLGQPPVSTGSQAYALQPSPDPDQAFVAYDPCRPVHYVVRPDNAPTGSDELIRQAVAEVSAATGLQFVNDGSTSEAPSEEREPFLPDLYGKRWAPVLITWSTPTEVPGLKGEVVGLGGSGYVQMPGQPLVLIAGQVKLDAPTLAEIMESPGGPARVRAVIMHELAHVVGLDHVNDSSQLMYEHGNAITEFGDGDRAGLALLGSGECAPRL